MLVLLMFVFSITTLAVDYTATFSGVVSGNSTNICTLVEGIDPLTGFPSTGLSDLFLSPGTFGSRVFYIEPAIFIDLDCLGGFSLSITAPSVITGTLQDDGNSFCLALGDDFGINSLDNPTQIFTSGYNGILTINMEWYNMEAIPDDSYEIRCTVTATPT